MSDVKMVADAKVSNPNLENEIRPILQMLVTAMDDADRLQLAVSESDMMKSLDDANARVKTLRDSVFLFIEENGLQNVKLDGQVTVSTVERHDYEVVDETAVRVYLRMQGILERYLVLDTKGVKKLASDYLKRNKKDMPGIQNRPVRFPQVRRAE